MAARPDVFVIGGGPVGLAVAIACARRGFRTVVSDSRTPPIDKACGEGMLPDGLPAARQLGIVPDGHLIRGISFQCGPHHIHGDFPEGPGRGVRRLALHEAMVRCAVQAGVELRWDAPVLNLDSIDARWFVGADGTGSRVRALAGLDQFSGTLNRFGFRRHFRTSPWTDSVEIHWGLGCQIYVTPVATDEVGIAVVSRNPKLRVEDALSLFPTLRERLAGREIASSERGAITGTRSLRCVVRGNLALAGDASGMVDAITGEGLGLGFRQALALADSLAAGDLRLYQVRHRRLARRPRLMARLLLSLDRSAAVRGLAMPAMAAFPAVFQRLLALHVGGDHGVGDHSGDSGVVTSSR